MAKVTKSNDLGFLGNDFQLKLVKCFFEDQEFFVSIQHIVDQNMFTMDALRRIVGFMKDRYANSSVVPTYFEIETLIRAKISDVITVEVILETLNSIKNMTLEGMDLVEDESGKFFKQQNLIKAINQVQEIIKKGSSSEYNSIADIFKKALEINDKQDNGWQLFDDIENDLKDNYREAITTGVIELDEALYGGLGKKELGLIVSPMGVGKTSICCGFAAGAAIAKTEANNYNGYKVLHFYHEDDDVSIRRKYYGYVLDIDACELSSPTIRPIALEKLNEVNEIHTMLKNNIKGERLKTGEVTASDIGQKIRAYIARGFKPDMVIVDYFECLKGEKGASIGDSEWTKEGVTMRKLESISNELNIALWVPVQGTKGSIGVDFVGLQHAGGSVSKTQIGHIVITLARPDEMKSKGKINLFIQKLRAARIGRDKFLGVGFNNGTCKFDMDVEDSTIDNMNFNSNNPAMQVAKSIAKERRNNGT